MTHILVPIKDLANHHFSILQQLCGITKNKSNQELYNDIAQHFGSMPADGKPVWDSWVTDDHSPLDWSVAFVPGKQHLRIIWEPQPIIPDNILETRKRLSLEYLKFLQAKYNVDVSTVSLILDVLEGEWARNIWFATDFGIIPPLFKLYIPGKTQESYDIILQRVGLLDAVRQIRSKISQQVKHSIEGIALDLLSIPFARTKVYFRLQYIEEDELLNLISSCGIDSTAYSKFLRHFLPDAKKLRESQKSYRYQTDEYFPGAITATFAFKDNCVNPTSCKLHLPVRFWFESDAALLPRVVGYLEENYGTDIASQYNQAIQSWNPRDLSTNSGIQSVISFQFSKSLPEFTVYISPEYYLTNGRQKQ